MEAQDTRGYARAFVFGATGYSGQAVVERLLELGVETIAHVRHDSPKLDAWKDYFKSKGAIVDATPWQIESMSETLGSFAPKAMFCLIGTTSARRRQLKRLGKDPRSASYEAVDFGLTDLLVKAAVASQVEPRFVYLSAVGTGPKALTAYMKARYKAEMAIINSGLPYTIIRPSFIAGKDREGRRSEYLFAQAVDKMLIIPARLGASNLVAKYASVDGKTLAKALVKAAFSPEYVDKILQGTELRSLYEIE